MRVGAANVIRYVLEDSIKSRSLCSRVVTFHFHDSIVRNVLAIGFLLRLCPRLIVLLRGDDHDRPTLHLLEGTHLASLRVWVNVRL